MMGAGEMNPGDRALAAHETDAGQTGERLGWREDLPVAKPLKLAKRTDQDAVLG